MRRSALAWIPRTLLAFAVTTIWSPAPSSAALVTLTSCGTVVVGRAQLTADLDCSAYPGHALVLDGNLSLNGFTLRGNSTDPAGYSAIDCTGKCRVRIKGPGTIVGGATAVSGEKVKLSKEITIRDAAEWGVVGAIVRASTVDVHANGAGLPVGPDGGGGIGGGKITVIRSHVDNNGSFGVNATIRAVLNHAHVLGNPVADLRSYEKPTAAKSTCLTSRRANLAETWNVCFGD
jgi:hypothetical protein